MADGPHHRGPRHPQGSRLVRGGLFADLVSFSELEARIAALPTEQERGDAFEVFAEGCLATQKVHQAQEVWPEATAPVSVMTALALPDADKGVDGLLRQLDGTLAAYQVKFRTGRPTLSWRELATFIGLADRVALRILFTNCENLAEVLNKRRDFTCVRGADLDRLTADDLAAIAAWLRGGVYEHEPKAPRPHQAAALDDIERGLQANDRATAVMACGSGKTLVALWLAERLRAKRILVLVPSLALIRQTLHEWLRETRWERPRFLACCSDPTVTSGADDSLVVRQSDLDFPVTTDADTVRTFMSSDSADGVRVVFSTYQSAQVVGDAMKGLPGFDLAIFDEAHKTAGREGLKFGYALDDKNIAIAKRVFLTATPRHYDVRKRDTEGDKVLVYSMDDPRTYGPIVHRLTFVDAARQGIICDCKVIISVVTSEMLNEDLLRHGDVIIEGDPVRARTVANQIALQKACEAHDLRKVFSFHGTVKSAADFTGDGASSVRVHLPSFDALHVSGAMPTARREKVMQAFREAERAVMSNARCLTEGVDVPAVDLVAFLSPRKSKVDIVQAAGRAMRKSGDKQVGYILLPLFVESGAGETIEEALGRGGFEEAWNVIQALVEQDDVLADIIREMREERGRRGGFDDTRLRERIEVLGPLVSLDFIREAVSAQIVERFGSTWDERFGELVAFKERNGDCRVPVKNAGKLGTWVDEQRTQFARGNLSPKRKARLDSIGFEWNPFESAWDDMFRQLQEYWRREGNCDVPNNYPANPKLSTWVGKQRVSRAKGTLSRERITQLDAIGFNWDPRDADWEASFSALAQFHAAHRHCDVPSTWKEDPALATWVERQRKLQKVGQLSEVRRARLDALGFVWDPREAAWNQKFSELENYKRANGHCNVPNNFPPNPSLAKWVDHQRQFFRRGELADNRRKALEEIGFVWDARSAEQSDFNEKMFSALVEFKKREGHCNVPQNYPPNPQLAKWVANRSNQYRAGKLAAAMRERLDELGFVWNRRDALWEARFSELREFHGRNGHCNVPAKYPPNLVLGVWVSSQRAKAASLSSDRKARLDALGFEWSRKD